MTTPTTQGSAARALDELATLTAEPPDFDRSRSGLNHALKATVLLEASLSQGEVPTKEDLVSVEKVLQSVLTLRGQVEKKELEWTQSGHDDRELLVANMISRHSMTVALEMQHALHAGYRSYFQRGSK